MKNWKMYVVISLLVIMSGLLSFSIYAAVKSYNGVANRTEFIRGDENVFVDLSAEYSGPPLLFGKDYKYNFRIDQNNPHSFDETGSIHTWDVGTSQFVAKEYEKITFTFDIFNLNKKKSLDIYLYDVAVDLKNRFETKVDIQEDEYTSTSQKLTPDSENGKTSGVSLIIGPNKGKTVTLTFSLLSYAERFEFINNMKMELNTEH